MIHSSSPDVERTRTLNNLGNWESRKKNNKILNTETFFFSLLLFLPMEDHVSLEMFGSGLRDYFSNSVPTIL